MALELTPTAGQFPLNGHLERHIDPSGAQTLDEVRATGQFTAVPKFASGAFTAASHWYRFTLARTADSPTDWILEFGAAYLDDIHLYVPRADGTFAEHRLGDHVPFLQRPLQTRLHAVKLSLPQTPVAIYVRVHSISTLLFFASAWQTDAFIAKEAQSNFYYGLFFGMLMLTVITYGVLGTWLRDASLLAYTVYVVTLLMFYLGTNGYAALIFAPDDGRWLDAVTGLGAIGGAIAGLLMWNQFLDLKVHFPRIYKLVMLSILPMAGSLFSITTGYYRIVAPYAFLLSVALAWLLTGLLIGRIVKEPRQPMLWLYLLAFIFATLGVAVQSAMTAGLLPLNQLTSNSYLIGTLVHVLALNLALAWRVKNMQMERLRAEHEASASRAKAQEQRQLVAMLSHEFRNPMAAISRSAQMLLLDLKGPAASRLEGIRDNADTLYALVDKFLAVESLESRAAMVARQETHLQALLAASLRELEGCARVALQITPHDATFALDRALFIIALSNLIGNALRYSPTELPVHVDAEVTAQGLQITIVDRGVGMSDEELSRVGTPYFRAAAAQGKRGIGLGFLLARKIVTIHGGTLHITSTPAKGTTVDIRLGPTSSAGLNVRG